MITLKSIRELTFFNLLVFLFQTLWPSCLFLSASLFSVFLLLDSKLVLNQSQQTISTTLAWGFFAALLYRRRQSGSRGSRIINWIVMGIGLILITYFTNKIAPTPPPLT